MNCPVCNEEVEASEGYAHLLLMHPEFLLIYFSVNNFDFVENTFDDYEYLSQLCEQMGNHYIGLSADEIDKCAPVYIIDSPDVACPICLESISEAKYARKITECKHAYCGKCIETWFSNHHTCPVCKIDIPVGATSASASVPPEQATAAANVLSVD